VISVTRVEKLSAIMEQLARVSKSFRKMKAGAIEISRNDIAVKSTAIFKNAEELYEIFRSSRDALMLAEIEEGTRQVVEVENLDKPKLRMIKGGKYHAD
jgi:hypothetical protein